MGQLVPRADTEPSLLDGLCVSGGLLSLHITEISLGGSDVALIGKRWGNSLEELSISLV
jgi:hypothetical protein